MKEHINKFSLTAENAPTVSVRKQTQGLSWRASFWIVTYGGLPLDFFQTGGSLSFLSLQISPESQALSQDYRRLHLPSWKAELF